MFFVLSRHNDCILLNRPGGTDPPLCTYWTGLGALTHPCAPIKQAWGHSPAPVHLLNRPGGTHPQTHSLTWVSVRPGGGGGSSGGGCLDGLRVTGRQTVSVSSETTGLELEGLSLWRKAGMLWKSQHVYWSVVPSEGCSLLFIPTSCLTVWKQQTYCVTLLHLVGWEKRERERENEWMNE